MESSIKIKCIIVGNVQVGKTSLIYTYKSNEFNDYIHRSFSDIEHCVDLDFENKKVNISLVDTNGSTEYDKIRPYSYKNADVFLICVSLEDIDDYKKICRKWSKEIRKYCSKASYILVGTKLDLKPYNFDSTRLRKIQKNIGASKYLGKELNCLLIMIFSLNFMFFFVLECSARTREGLSNLFMEVANLVVNKSEAPSQNSCHIS